MATFFGTFENLWNKTLFEVSMKTKDLLTYPLPITLVSGIIISMIGPVSTVANGIVIYAIWKDPFKRLRSSPSNIIIASMATCDFLVGVVCTSTQATLFFSIYANARNITRFWTPVAFGVGRYLISVSLFHVLALTIDRFVAVVYPLRYKSRVTSSKMFTSVVMIWAFMIVLILLGILLQNHFPIYLIIANFVYHLAVITFTVLSLFIILNVRKQTRDLKRNSALGVNLKAAMLRDKKTTKSILFILVVFEVCFFPIFVMEIVMFTCTVCHYHLNIMSVIYSASFVLTHVNSCLNPFIYAFRLPKFRKPVALITKRLLCRRVDSHEENGYVLDNLHTTSNGKHSEERLVVSVQPNKSSIIDLNK